MYFKFMVETITSILSYWWIKIAATIPLCYLTFSRSHIEVVYGIMFIVTVDTVLGIWTALKYRKFNSNRMAKFANKVGIYGLAMCSIWVLAAMEPGLFGWSFRYVGIFIILTEIFSNFEKLALLGFKIPTKLLSGLNDKFKELYETDNGMKKEVAEKIIDNHK